MVVTAQELDLVTWNIRYAEPADGPDRWERRRSHVAGLLVTGRFPVIALQEALIAQLRYLDPYLLRHERFGVGREDGATRGEFCAVYVDTTVLSPLDSRTFWLAPDRTRPARGWDAACERVVTMVVVKHRATGDTLTILNTHWDHVGTEARRESARIIAELVRNEQRLHRRVVLLGDLNATDDDPALQELHGLLTDAYPPEQRAIGTFNGFGNAEQPFKRIDHILYSPVGWTTSNYSVHQLPMPGGRFPSDHFPVMVRMHLR